MAKIRMEIYGKWMPKKEKIERLAGKSFIIACISNNKNYYVQIKSRELDWHDLKA